MKTFRTWTIFVFCLLLTTSVFFPTFSRQAEATPSPTPPEELPEKWEIEGVKHEGKKRKHCGPSALAAIMRYYGCQTSERELGNLFVRSRGISFSDLIEIALKHDFKAQYIRDDFEELKSRIAQNHPLYISIRGKERDRENHAIVLTGYDDVAEIVYSQDSSGEAETSYEDFLEYWGNAGRWALLFTPQSEAEVQALKTAKPRAESVYKWLVNNKPDWWESVLVYVPRETNAKKQYYKIADLFEDNKKLIKGYTEMIRLHPEDPYYCAQALVYIGNNYSILKDYKMQFRIAEKIIEVYPKQEEACALTLYARGNTYSRDYRKEEAEKVFRRIVEDYPDQTEYRGRALRRIAGYLEDRGDYESAADYYRRSIDAYPESHRVHAYFGNLKYLRGDLAGATESYQKALEHKEDYPYPMRRLGEVYAKVGDLKKSQESYRQFINTAEDRIKQNPDEYGAYYDLGKYYLEVENDPHKALLDMHKAHKRCEPETDTWVMSYLGLIYARNGAPRRGIRLINEVLENKPKDTYSHYWKALVLVEMGDISEAIAELETAISLCKCFEYFNNAKKLLADLQSRQGKEDKDEHPLSPKDS